MTYSERSHNRLQRSGAVLMQAGSHQVYNLVINLLLRCLQRNGQGHGIAVLTWLKAAFGHSGSYAANDPSAPLSLLEMQRGVKCNLQNAAFT